MISSWVEISWFFVMKLKGYCASAIRSVKVMREATGETGHPILFLLLVHWVLQVGAMAHVISW